MAENGHLQEILSESFSKAEAIFQNYDLPTEPLREAARELGEFRVTVPFLGAFNTGKSAALNALLGEPLLPTGIAATTALPTEILWGADRVTLWRDGQKEEMSLARFRDKAPETAGAQLLRLEVKRPFLRRLPGLTLVDLPGLDSGIMEHEHAVRGYLPRCLAYLLFFSADEPVLKQSAAELLAALPLREKPAFVALTKCDKLPPGAVQEAVDWISAELREAFGLADVPVVCLSVRPKRAIKPLEELLLRLQGQAGDMRRERFARRLRELCESGEERLRARLEGESFAASELENLLRRLDSRGAELRDALEAERRRFEEELLVCRERIRRRIIENLRETKVAIFSLLVNHEDPHPQTDRLLHGLLSVTVESEFTTLLLRYLRGVLNILETRRLEPALWGGLENLHAAEEVSALLAHFSGEAPEKPAREPPAEPPAVKAPTAEGAPRPRRRVSGPEDLPASLLPPGQLAATEAPPKRRRPVSRAVLGQFPGTEGFFAALPPEPARLPRAKQEELWKERMLETVLPGLLELSERAVEAALEQCTAEMHETIDAAFTRDFEERSRALRSLREEKSREDSQRETRLAALRADLAALGELRREAGELLRPQGGAEGEP